MMHLISFLAEASQGTSLTGTEKTIVELGSLGALSGSIFNYMSLRDMKKDYNSLKYQIMSALIRRVMHHEEPEE